MPQSEDHRNNCPSILGNSCLIHLTVRKYLHLSVVHIFKERRVRLSVASASSAEKKIIGAFTLYVNPYGHFFLKFVTEVSRDGDN